MIEGSGSVDIPFGLIMVPASPLPRLSIPLTVSPSLSTLQEIEHQLRERFRRDLPTMIHRLSQKWLADIRGSSTSTPTNEIVVKREADSDLEDSRAGAVAATINPESREPDDSFHDYLGGGPGAEGEAGNSTNNPSPRRVAGDSRAQSEPPAPSNNLPGARKARTRGYSVTVSSSNVTDTSAPQNTSPTPYRAHHEQRNVPLATSPVHPRNSSSLHSEHSYLSSSPSESATTSGSEAEEDEDPVDPDSRSLASASETEDGTASEIDASYNYEYSRSADSNASSFYLYGHSPTDSEGFSLGSYDDLPETPPRHPSSSEHRMRRDPSGRSPLHADTETTVSRQRRRGSGGFADSDGPRDEQSGQQGGQGTRGRYKSPILQSLQRSGSTFATTFSKTLPASIVSSSDLQDENTSSRVINGGRDGALSSSSSAAHALPGEAYNALLADGRESTAKSNLQDTNAAVDATTATTKVRRRRLHRLDGSSVSPSVSPVKPRSSSRHHQREKEKMRIKKRELDEYFPMISGDGDDDTGTISTARDGSPSRTHKTSGRKGAPTRSMDTLLLPTNPPQTQHLTLPLSSTGHTGTLNTFDPRRGTSRPALVDRQLNSVPSLRRSMMNTRLRDSDYFTPSYPE